MEGFEGYVGIRLWDNRAANDVIFAVLLVQMMIFALVYHTNYRLFGKMTRDIFRNPDHQGVLDDISGAETIFRLFIVCQSLFLCSIAIFVFGRMYGRIAAPDISDSLLTIGTIFIVLCLFYLFKRLLYKLMGTTFVGSQQYKSWRTGYRAAMGLWGILLYIPVTYLIFSGSQARIPTYLFFLLYILWRTAILYRALRLFRFQALGGLYIILYLCAEEILPLFLLYEGAVYLYNLY